MTRGRNLTTCAATLVAVLVAGCGPSSSPSAGETTSRPPAATSTDGATERTRPPTQSEPPPLSSTPKDSPSVDQTSLASVTYAYERSLNPFNGDVDAAWSLVDPSCRPESQYKALKKFFAGVSVERMLKGVPEQSRAKVLKAFEQRTAYRVRPLDVVYDGQQGPRTPLASTPDGGATGAVIFAHADPDNRHQTTGITRFVKHGATWWVDLRTGAPDPSSSSAFAKRTTCAA